MVKKVCLLVTVLLLSLGLSGCLVGEGKYLKKVEEAESLDKSLTSLQQQYKVLSAENDTLKSTVEKLSKDLNTATKEKEKLLADNKELDKVLKAKSDTLSKNIADLRQKIAALEGENAALKDEIANLKKAKEEEVQKTSKTYEDLLEKMKSEISQGQVTISELKGKLTVNMVDAVLFDSGKAEVKPEGLVVLQKVVDIVKNIKDKAIRIEGHTDNDQIVGALAKKYPTNWELSAARAINVTRYLQQQGIDPLNLSAIAYGEFKPVADNTSREGKAKNRRIEIILVPKE
ncbi:OmpA family protein [Geotalea sp. SG265]|uniref:OmpA/MotB family protein n=1 Tax=Geotalea sp. SG265 TaxID=2922867 RepID=UPI001FAF4748|nr:OmpA family protein [Geotalea sp. SG265]